ncbi:hypothetical protein J6590_067810 [Homalodisca vitripennis]|nr:hypothetical protein J6590_067810 [Homalodisca vitripennis]
MNFENLVLVAIISLKAGYAIKFVYPRHQQNGLQELAPSADQKSQGWLRNQVCIQSLSAVWTSRTRSWWRSEVSRLVTQSSLYSLAISRMDLENMLLVVIGSSSQNYGEDKTASPGYQVKTLMSCEVEEVKFP